MQNAMVKISLSFSASLTEEVNDRILLISNALLLDSLLLLGIIIISLILILIILG